MSGSGPGGGSGTTWREQVASVWAAIAAAVAAPVASALRSVRFVVRSMPARSASRPAALANHHQQAQLVLFEADVHVDPVGHR
jgi:hypothetical protein